MFCLTQEREISEEDEGISVGPWYLKKGRIERYIRTIKNSTGESRLSDDDFSLLPCAWYIMEEG
jgi:hypothetical protein